MGIELEHLLQYLDGLLEVEGFPDYPGAANGLQVEAAGPVSHLAVAVDASQETIEAALEVGADLLLVHHGIFWQGLRPLTGRRYRRAQALIRGGVGLYSVHLPLDAHAELGNCVLLARRLELDVQGRFGQYEDREIGWWGLAREAEPASFREKVAGAVGGGPVRLLEGGSHPVRRVGVVTGGGASFLEEAARRGLDTLVTGEASHHAYVDARELGVHLVLAGHYATETFGVQAVATHLAERFDLSWDFLDFPSGL